MFAGLIVFLFFLLIYSLGVSPSSFGGDSGDIILSYFFGGVSHPPGYPLNTMLGYFLTHGPLLILDKPFIWRANFVSAIYHAIALGLLFVLIKRLTKSSIVAFFGVATLGFSVLFWLYAHNAEVFQLAAVLILVSLNFLFKFWMRGKKERKLIDLYLSFLFLGFAVFHHQTALLLLPAYFYFLWQFKNDLFKSKVVYLKLGALFLLGAVPYIYDIWQGLRNNPYNWANPTTLSAFFRLISRADYGTFSASKDLIGSTFQQRYLQIIWYFKVFKADFSPIGLALFAFGAFFLFFKSNKYFWFFIIAWFFCGPFFLFYSSFPIIASFTKGVIERFVLISYLFVTIFVGFGVFGIVEIVKSSKLIKNKALLVLIGLSFLIFPLALFWVDFNKADLSNYQTGDVFAKDILFAANPPGIIIPGGDTSSFNTEVAYYVNGVNSDSIIIYPGRLSVPWYRKTFVKKYPNLIFPQNFNSQEQLDAEMVLSELISLNIDKFPIYFYDQLSAPSEYQLVQQGMLLRLYRKPQLPDDDSLAKTIIDRTNGIKFNIDAQKQKYTQLFEDQIETDYVDRFYRNGKELQNLNKFADSRVFFAKALEIDSSNKQALFGLGVSYIEEGECQNSKEVFEKILDIDSNYWQALLGLGNVYRDCLSDKTKSDDYFKKADEVRKKQLDTPVEKL